MGRSVDAGQTTQLGVERRVERRGPVPGGDPRHALVGAVERRLAAAGAPGAVRLIVDQGGAGGRRSRPSGRSPYSRQVDAVGERARLSESLGALSGPRVVNEVPAERPSPSSRQSPAPLERARERVRAILAEHRPPALAPSIDAELRRLVGIKRGAPLPE